MQAQIDGQFKIPTISLGATGQVTFLLDGKCVLAGSSRQDTGTRWSHLLFIVCKTSPGSAEYLLFQTSHSSSLYNATSWDCRVMRHQLPNYQASFSKSLNTQKVRAATYLPIVEPDVAAVTHGQTE